MLKSKLTLKQIQKCCSKVGSAAAKVATFVKDIAVVKDFIEQLL